MATQQPGSEPEAPTGQGKSSQPLPEVLHSPIPAMGSPQQAQDAAQDAAQYSCAKTWPAVISTKDYEKPAEKLNSPYAYKKLEGSSVLTKDTAGNCVT